MNRKTVPTIRTASPTLPIPIPAFAPVDKPLGDDDAVGDEVDEDDVCVWLLCEGVLVLDEVVELVEEIPSEAASTISWPVPQQSVLCVPQHHFSDEEVPSQGVISAFPLLSTF